MCSKLPTAAPLPLCIHLYQPLRSLPELPSPLFIIPQHPVPMSQLSAPTGITREPTIQGIQGSR